MSKIPGIPEIGSESRFLPFQSSEKAPAKDMRLQPIGYSQKLGDPAPEWQKTRERVAAEELVITQVNQLRYNKEFLGKVLSSIENKVMNPKDVSGLTFLDAQLLQMYAQMGKVKSEFIQQQLEILSRAVQELNIAQGQRKTNNIEIQNHFFKEKGFTSALMCIDAFFKADIDAEYPERLPKPEQRQVYVNNHLDAKNKIDLVVLDAQENGSFIAHFVQVKSSGIAPEEQSLIIDHHRSCTDRIARLGQSVESPKLIEVPTKELRFKDEAEYRDFVVRLDTLILDYLMNNDRERLVEKLFKGLRRIERTGKNPGSLEGRALEAQAYLRGFLKNPLLTTATQADVGTLLEALDAKVMQGPVEETKFAPISSIYSVTYVPSLTPSIEKLYGYEPVVGAENIPLLKIKTTRNFEN